MLLSLLLLIALLLIIDFYGFRGMRKLFSHRKLTSLRSFALWSYWVIDIIFLVFAFFWAWHIRSSELDEYVKYRKFFVIFGGFMMIFLPKSAFALFTLIYDLKRVFLKFSASMLGAHPGVKFAVLKFRRSLIVPAAGFLAAALMFSLTLYGVGIGRNNFTVEEQTIWFDDLPESFDGYRIAQFSDTHLGSYSQTDAVQAGLEIINGLHPDVIVFTGDLVNNEAAEAMKFVDIFRTLQPKDGMFSILGNHDMGDYRRWGTIAEKESNLGLLVEVQQSMGFKVLLNEHVFIHRGSDSIMIAGVENWGLPPFAQHGDLAAATGSFDPGPFTVLLSHDPSHWRAQVLPDSKVQLTLSGHTHGMQMGVSNRFFSWSPVQLKYNEWNGLYEDASRYLYVNRGFGFLSFPGRIGMPPEITLITLRRSGNEVASRKN